MRFTAPALTTAAFADVLQTLCKVAGIFKPWQHTCTLQDSHTSSSRSTCLDTQRSTGVPRQHHKGHIEQCVLYHVRRAVTPPGERGRWMDHGHCW